jgi:hypothetical protein
MTGRVRIDVKQYRVTGRFRMMSTGDGDVTFEFTGTMALGGHHEDAVVSFHGGELRILDRERARFYEGAEAVALIRDGLDVDWDLAQLIRRITAQLPDCERLSTVSYSRRDGSARLEGRLDGTGFKLEFEDGRIVEASWPVQSEGGPEDRMNVTYRWEVADPAGDAQNGQAAVRGAALRQVVVFLEGRRWRIKLDAK